MKKHIAFVVAFSTAIVAYSCSVKAPQTVKVSRIGYLASHGASLPQPFVQALRDLGYIEGENTTFEYRTAEGHSERNLDLAVELAQLKVDIIVVDGTSPSLAAKKATSTIPIVMMTSIDPTTNGLVASLARPGGNITGLVIVNGQSGKNLATLSLMGELLVTGKRLALLKEILPKLSRVGILRDADSAARINTRWYEVVAGPQKLEIQYLDVGQNPNLAALFDAALNTRVDALIMASTPGLKAYRKQIADLAVKNGLALVSEAADDVEEGGLLSYGWPEADAFRHVAIYVDKILKGAKPSELSVETWPCVNLRITPADFVNRADPGDHSTLTIDVTGKVPAAYANNCEPPTQLGLAINLKAAKQIGLTIPPNVLARADKVIK
jgi:ABC-type uncharacterized transport system substrate-binding protein